MVMEKRRKIDAKWYKQIPNRNRVANMIPNLSRPSSRISKVGSLQNSLQEADWGSIGSQRSSSRLSNVFDSPNTSFSFRRRRQSKGDIEDILSKHQVARPRSVSLVKYDPLPAISSDATKNQKPNSGVSSSGQAEKTPNEHGDRLSESNQAFPEGLNISPIEEHETEDSHQDSDKEENDLTTTHETENEEKGDSSGTTKGERPKLVRSRTFDVIETNLTNLPVIGDSSDSSELETSQNEGDSESVEVGRDDRANSKPKVEVKVSIDGISLNTFLTQTDEDSPLSPLSLVTHPGSPDSGFAVGSGSSHQDPCSNCQNDDMSEFSDGETADDTPSMDIYPLENKISVKLPDLSSIEMKLNVDVTLRDFLASLQTLEWKEKRFHIVEEIEDKLLSEPLSKFHFNNNTQVYLIPDT